MTFIVEWTRPKAFGKSGLSTTYNEKVAAPLITVYTTTLTESVTASDSLLKITTRILSDTATLSDVLTKIPVKVLAELVTLSDSLLRSIARILSEGITLVDSVIRVLTRVLLDSITAVDTLISLWISSILRKLTSLLAFRRPRIVKAAPRKRIFPAAARPRIYMARRDKTMVIEEYEKQSTEGYTKGIDFKSVLPAGDTIAISGTAVTSKNEDTGADSTATMVTGAVISGTQLIAKIHQGNHLENHLIEYHVKSSAGEDFEDEIRCKVRDV